MDFKKPNQNLVLSVSQGKGPSTSHITPNEEALIQNLKQSAKKSKRRINTGKARFKHSSKKKKNPNLEHKEVRLQGILNCPTSDTLAKQRGAGGMSSGTTGRETDIMQHWKTLGLDPRAASAHSKINELHRNQIYGTSDLNHTTYSGRRRASNDHKFSQQTAAAYLQKNNSAEFDLPYNDRSKSQPKSRGSIQHGKDSL